MHNPEQSIAARQQDSKLRPSSQPIEEKYDFFGDMYRFVPASRTFSCDPLADRTRHDITYIRTPEDLEKKLNLIHHSKIYYRYVIAEYDRVEKPVDASLYFEDLSKISGVLMFGQDIQSRNPSYDLGSAYHNQLASKIVSGGAVAGLGLDNQGRKRFEVNNSAMSHHPRGITVFSNMLLNMLACGLGNLKDVAIDLCESRDGTKVNLNHHLAFMYQFSPKQAQVLYRFGFGDYPEILKEILLQIQLHKLGDDPQQILLLATEILLLNPSITDIQKRRIDILLEATGVSIKDVQQLRAKKGLSRLSIEGVAEQIHRGDIETMIRMTYGSGSLSSKNKRFQQAKASGEVVLDVAAAEEQPLRAKL